MNKVKKIYLYLKACHRGEIFKRIEYKIKDFLGYFYIRNKLQATKKHGNMYNIKINMPNIDAQYREVDKYRIFNNEYNYKEFIKKLKVERKFWRKINLKQYEDVKVVWEHNRLQILLPLVVKYLRSKKNEYKEYIQKILDYWNENNPFEYTVNWNSNLEVAIRAINIVLSLLLLQDEKLNRKYSEVLYLHAEHIYNEIDYSDCCIPNNHVIGEATALLILSKVMDSKENKKWYKKSINILKKYLKIIDDDGVSRENSFSYQYFVTKMYILALCFIEEKDVFNEVNKKVIDSLEILKFTIIDENRILNYGDNDDGFLYSIYINYNIAKDIQEYYELFFENRLNNETKIYMQILNKFNSKNKIKNGKAKKDNYIITKNIFIYKQNNNLLFFNAKDITGHAHNDSLAINLVINGKEVLLDSGTYSYNKSDEDRKYYRSRKSHTTIQLKKNNAISIGSFRWINQAKCYISKFQKDSKEIIVEGIIKDLATRSIKIIDNEIQITDKNLQENSITTNWITSNEIVLYKDRLKSNEVEVIYSNAEIAEEKKILVSDRYLETKKAKAFEIKRKENNVLETKIIIKEK